MDKPKEIFLTIPRMSGKRLVAIVKAMQLAKEGNQVMIRDIGGQNTILEPFQMNAKDALLQRKVWKVND